MVTSRWLLRGKKIFLVHPALTKMTSLSGEMGWNSVMTVLIYETVSKKVFIKKIKKIFMSISFSLIYRQKGPKYEIMLENTPPSTAMLFPEACLGHACLSRPDAL